MVSKRMWINNGGLPCTGVIPCIDQQVAPLTETQPPDLIRPDVNRCVVLASPIKAAQSCSNSIQALSMHTHLHTLLWTLCDTHSTFLVKQTQV